MLHVDIAGTLAKAITPSKGIPEQDLSGLRTGLSRYTNEWLKEREAGEHEWSMDPYNKDTINQVKEVVATVKQERIQTIVWVGIGGSGLGPKVIQEMFEDIETLEFILLDTIDPVAIERLETMIDWKHTLLVVVSKSGGTLEPMSVFFYCFERLKEAIKNDGAIKRTVAVTDPERGILHRFCTEHGIRMLPIPPGVGGRYSIFTPVGLLPLGLLGGDIDAFVRGAKEMDTLCQNTDLDHNPALQLAVVQFLLDTKRNYNVRVIMPYVQQLASLGRWNQQLVAESLGKTELRNPIPLAAIGTQDQHSLLQQWMEGPRQCWHLFIRTADKPRLTVPTNVTEEFQFIAGKTFGQLLNACYEGTSGALTQAKRPHATITLGKQDEYHLGQLFFVLLAEVVFLGKLYRIDPYGQPGVEAGKKITKEMLSRGQES